MAYIRKTSTGYRAEIEFKSIRKSKTFKTKGDATLWAAQQETAIHEELTIAPAARVTLRQLLEAYRDVDQHRNVGVRWENIRIDAFLAHPEWLPLDKKIGQVTTDDIVRFRDLRAKTVASGTILRELGLLSGVFAYAISERKWIKDNPVRGMKKPSEPPARERLISRAEIKKMLRGMDYHPQMRIGTITQSVAVCFLLALRTGMRASEMTQLTWDDVHPYHVNIKLDKVNRKQGKGRDVPLSKKSVRLIEKMRGFDSNSVFYLSSQTLDARFRAVREKVGLTVRDQLGEIDDERSFKFHDARHTAATWLSGKFKSNKDIAHQQAVFDLCKIFGWTDPKRAMDYYNPRIQDLAARLN